MPSTTLKPLRLSSHPVSSHPALAQRWTLLGLLLAAVYALFASSPTQPARAQGKQDAKIAGEKADAANEEKSATVVMLQVPLPLTGNTDQMVQGQISRALKRLPKDARRPTLILEFKPAADTAGEGSDFGRAHSLARFLVSEDLAQAKTIAWLPRPIKGHAVLPVLACEQIVMAKDAELGAAGIDEKLLDETMRGAYREFALRRRTIPAAVALGMLDTELEVFKVSTAEGVRFEAAEALAGLRAQGIVTKEETLFRAGEPHVLSGAEMRFHGFATHLADDKNALAAALDLPLTALRAPLVPDDGWRAMRVDIDGPVTQKKVNWVLRVVDDHVDDKDFNLLCIFINSAGGNTEQSIRLASKLASLGKEVRTVAVVQREARADAGIIAWACDDLVMFEGARIGGQGDAAKVRKHDRDALRPPLEQIAQQRQRRWSLPLAMVDADTEVWPYQRMGSADVAYLSAEEWNQLPDKDEWQRTANAISVMQGLDAKTASDIGLATHVVLNLDEFRNVYHLEGELQSVRSNWALAAIEWLADPRLSALLLFVAMFALMIEFSSPGIGLPGFIAFLCFVLYFWSNFLHGNATGLEICLFLAGIICVLIEVFVAPGTFVFGIGGALMIVSSLILASQTFVLPTNTYQLRQTPVSLAIFSVGIAGGIAAIALIRRFLPDTPYFNKMILKPPQDDELEERLTREQLVQWAHLAGKRGVTTTALFPSGKALFGDELVDVVSSGEMIAKGAQVVVVEVLGSRVLVREA